LLGQWQISLANKINKRKTQFLRERVSPMAVKAIKKTNIAHERALVAVTWGQGFQTPTLAA